MRARAATVAVAAALGAVIGMIVGVFLGGWLVYEYLGWMICTETFGLVCW